MRINGTQQAFKALLEIRGISTTLGVERSTVSIWKKRIRDSRQYPTEKTMIKFLKIAGARIIRNEVVWELKEAA